MRKELKLARKVGNKQFIYFRHRDLARKIVVDLENEKLDLGKQEQVSFETKEELLRLAHNILLKNQNRISVSQDTQSSIIKQHKTPKDERAFPLEKSKPSCAMCSKMIEGQPIVELIGEKMLNFDCKECVRTYKKFRSMYGEDFQ